MPARLSIGLASSLPLHWEQEAVFNHLKEFATFGFIDQFFEVIDGKLYRIANKNGSPTVTEIFPDKVYPEWNPNNWIKNYTYSEWYTDIVAAWNTRGIRGDITYDEWSNMYVDIFVPSYDVESRSVRFSGLEKSFKVCEVETGFSLARELDLPKYFWEALGAAQEFLFLVKISG